MLESLLFFKYLIVTTAEVYKFHALINRNEKKKKKKKTAMELKCNNFKITM